MASDSISFSDFDDQDVFNNAISQTKSHKTRNFVLEFNSSTARCAFDVDASNIKSLLETNTTDSQTPATFGTRWIHIWRPEDQKDFVQTVTGRYGLSPRLSLSMLSDPLVPQPVGIESHRTTSRMRDLLHNRSHKLSGKTDPKTGNDKVVALMDLEADQTIDAEHMASSLDLNHYRIVNELWHFMSVDWGHSYTSIGYNALYNTKADASSSDLEENHARPKGTRIWWWIVLCEDNTVISIQENPFPGVIELDTRQQRQLEAVRYNLINVFRQLSNVGIDAKQQNPILTTNIRSGRTSSHAETQIAEEDSQSLLLYYLFDDWYSIYSLVAKSEHQYRLGLDEIRREMFRSPEIKHVHRLHSLGRQLGTLKRMYEGYELIIERVMNGPQQKFKHQAAKLTDRYAALLTGRGRESSRQPPEGYGVPIREPAALRFERLSDRIKLYALSEIQSCLEETETLMSMNFNLIAIKEESYVERLTRITILLAKVTILFLPVTLMSTYFTIQFTDIEYTPTEFWVAFAVIFFASSIGLVLFGVLSGTQEATPIYKSLTRSAIDTWKTLRGEPKKRLV